MLIENKPKNFEQYLLILGMLMCIFPTTFWLTDFKWILFRILIISSSVSDWLASNSLEILFEISVIFKFCWNGLLIKEEIPSILLNSPNLAWISLSTISILFINFFKSHLLTHFWIFVEKLETNMENGVFQDDLNFPSVKLRIVRMILWHLSCLLNFCFYLANSNWNSSVLGKNLLKTMNLITKSRN